MSSPSRVGQLCDRFSAASAFSYVGVGVFGFKIFGISFSFSSNKKYFGFHRFKVLSQTHSFLLNLNNLNPCTTRDHLTTLSTRACIILLPPAMDISVQVINCIIIVYLLNSN